MLVSSVAEIALSLQPSPASDTSAFRRMRALVSNCAGLLPARTSASSCSRSPALNFTTYFLTAISFPATNHLRRCLTATEIQKNTPHSRTRATRPLEHVRAIGIEPGRGHLVHQARLALLAREAGRTTVQHVAGYERL